MQTVSLLSVVEYPVSRSIPKDSKSKDPIELDAVVLAGTEGSAEFELESGKVHKPFLEFEGQSLVLRVVKSVMKTPGLAKVYVVGDSVELKQALAPLLGAEHSGRLKIVRQTGNLVQNCLGTFFDHILVDRGFPEARGIWPDAVAVRHFVENNPEIKQTGVLVVTSDLPFLASEDLKSFLAEIPQDASLCAGLCDHGELEKMQEALGNETVLDRWKLGAIPIRARQVRWNNLWFAKPLMAHPGLYNLLQDVYSHRYLLNSDGRVRWSNWWSIIRAVAHYGFRVRGVARFGRGFLNLAGLMLASGLARWAGRAGKYLAWPFRTVLGQGDLEFVASLVLGVKTSLLIGTHVAPAVDIDVPESYLALSAHGEENYRRVLRYLGRNPLRNTGESKPPMDKPELKIISGGKS